MYRRHLKGSDRVPESFRRSMRTRQCHRIGCSCLQTRSNGCCDAAASTTPEVVTAIIENIAIPGIYVKSRCEYLRTALAIAAVLAARAHRRTVDGAGRRHRDHIRLR